MEKLRCAEYPSFNPVLQSELSLLGSCNLLIALPSFIWWVVHFLYCDWIPPLYYKKTGAAESAWLDFIAV